jgi:hypothetical protein
MFRVNLACTVSRHGEGRGYMPPFKSQLSSSKIVLKNELCFWAPKTAERNEIFQYDYLGL